MQRQESFQRKFASRDAKSTLPTPAVAATPEEMKEAAQKFLAEVLDQATHMDAKSKQLDEVWPAVLAAILKRSLKEYRAANL